MSLDGYARPGSARIAVVTPSKSRLRGHFFPTQEDTLAAAKTSGIAAALLEVQKNAPSIQKDAINPHYKNHYISLDSLMPQILPLLNEQQVVLVQLPSTVGDPGPEPQPALTTRLIHVPSGETLEATVPLVLDKENSQGLGSAITYTRRYALLSILGLVADKDDDGEKASKTRPKGKPEVVNKPGSRKKKTDENEEGW